MLNDYTCCKRTTITRGTQPAKFTAMASKSGVQLKWVKTSEAVETPYRHPPLVAPTTTQVHGEQ